VNNEPEKHLMGYATPASTGSPEKPASLVVNIIFAVLILDALAFFGFLLCVVVFWASLGPKPIGP
jgi:hypothetical protein